MTTITAVISVGRDTGASHDEVRALVFEVVARRPVEVLSATEGTGWYEGVAEPCSSFTVTGPRSQVDGLAAKVADHAYEVWGQECVGFVRMRVEDWRDSCQFPRPSVLTRVALRK